ncbi:MAG TPA: zf-HC2 domain-containing protein [Anaerolineales bacterium]|nr:zf-HC2 domain-containing protein [Anaerolineales bacterium]
MNKHLDDGQLRAALDGELSPEGRRHLEDCSACRTRQKLLETRTRRVADKLAFLSSTKDVRLSTPQAWHRFNQQIITQKEIPMLKKLTASPLVRYALPALLILTLIFAFPGTRALASQLLDLFRIQQVAVVPIDVTGIQQLNGDGPLGKQISQLISNSMTITQKPGDPIEAQDAHQASQLADFTVRLPEGMTPSRISVMKSSAFTLTVDRAKVDALLKEAGRSDLVLPDSVDGAEISVNVPAGVSVSYGTCPKPGSDGEGSGPDRAGSRGRRYADCVILAQIPSPTVTAPPNVNVPQLAQIALEFTGMTSEQATAFTDTVDWTSTLVIPIPKNAATYQQIPVDGVTGTLIQRPSDDAPQFALLWVKDGIIYTIGGLGSNSQQAIQMANSLR